MQNVVWPITIVQKPGGRSKISPPDSVDFSAMPVTMPGSAIGSTMMNARASRPMNRLRYTAPASMLPSTIAPAVVIAATSNDSRKACHMSARVNATRNHSRVNPGGGNGNDDDWVVNAYRTMIARGKYRNSTTSPDASFSPRPASDTSRLTAPTS